MFAWMFFTLETVPISLYSALVKCPLPISSIRDTLSMVYLPKKSEGIWYAEEFLLLNECTLRKIRRSGMDPGISHVIY